MKERPILFSAPMVRALLAGTKTQTRRVAKGVVAVHSRTGEALAKLDSAGPRVACPYGQPGDRLWVREAFRFTDLFDGDSPARVGERCVDAGYRKPWAPLQFEADGQRTNWQHVATPPNDGPPRPGKLRPGMFMPRWASRITLEVTGVRVERLQDISETDAIAEGIERLRSGRGYFDPSIDKAAAARLELHWPTAREAYRALWESINGPGSWDATPWVWVLEFRRLA